MVLVKIVGSLLLSPFLFFLFVVVKRLMSKLHHYLWKSRIFLMICYGCKVQCLVLANKIHTLLYYRFSGVKMHPLFVASVTKHILFLCSSPLGIWRVNTRGIWDENQDVIVMFWLRIGVMNSWYATYNLRIYVSNASDVWKFKRQYVWTCNNC